MKYFIQLFSPETHIKFTNSSRTVIGFKKTLKYRIKHLGMGDRLICYVSKLSRFCGILEISSEPFIENTPIFIRENDIYVIMFYVKTIIWLDQYHSIPIKDEEIWKNLTFTKNLSTSGNKWKGKIRSSLGSLNEFDGKFLEALMTRQDSIKIYYDISEDILKKLIPR